MDDRAERVSDADRDEMVDSLREHLVAGRLTLDEFGERVDNALQARTRADLVAVRNDLPARTDGSAVAGRRRTLRITAALFAHVVRRGRLLLRRRSTVVALMSDVDLDLRDASVAGARTSLWVLAVLGNVDVYVPDDVEVEVSGLAMIGHRRDWGDGVDRTWAPLIAVRVVSLFGTVDVWRVPRAMRGDYGEIIEAVRHPQRRLSGGAGSDSGPPRRRAGRRTSSHDVSRIDLARCWRSAAVTLISGSPGRPAPAVIH